MARDSAPVLDTPWHRPGSIRYAWSRLHSLLRPPITVTEPAPGSVVSELDVAVPVRDGTVLRVNVYRPPTAERVPVIMCAHPYGKDRLPSVAGRRIRFSPQYRIMNQAAPVSFSTLTGWEAPDAAWWVAQGFAVINADLRGAGTSDGVGSLMSDLEAEDYEDLITWAGSRSWSTGRVGLLGVSYLAMSQYKVAGRKPPNLEAICPWEGMTDSYRDLMRPGGLEEHGFTFVWTTMTRRVARISPDIGTEERSRPLRDAWWESITPDLAAIEVPMLVCASFSDNNLHSRGSFRAFERVGSPDRFAFTHRGGKWATFYSEPARSAQLAFFDRYLRDRAIPKPPTVRLEVRESRDRVVGVRSESEWPLSGTQWQPLHLGPGGRLSAEPAQTSSTVTFHTRRRAAAFSHTFDRDTELTGPMSLRVWVAVDSGDDVDLYAGIEKWRGRQYVGFEGSYGFGRDRVSTGWQRASLRRLDEHAATEAEPVHTFDRHEPLVPGRPVPVEISLGPSATLFRAGESLRLVIAGRWLWPRNPLTGQFPAHYRGSPVTRCTVCWGPEQPSRLLVPRIPSPRP
jgi:predicted acyl esterase